MVIEMKKKICAILMCVCLLAGCSKAADTSVATTGAADNTNLTVTSTETKADDKADTAATAGEKTDAADKTDAENAATDKSDAADKADAENAADEKNDISDAATDKSDAENEADEIIDSDGNTVSDGSDIEVIGTDESKEYIPRVITDAIGREVSFDVKPERIISGYYISSSILMALGLNDNFVGIEAKANSRNIYALAAPELIELPNVGSAKQFDFEGAVALEPDLVILPKKLKDYAGSFDELGIKVVFVNPETLSDLYETIDNLAVICNVEERAGELIEYINGVNDLMKSRLDEENFINGYMAGNSSYLETAPAGMYQSGMLELAGIANVAADIEDSYWSGISYETLIQYNPDIIIIASDAEYTAEDLMNDENLQSVAAVENGCVYELPSVIEAWDSPVPSAFLGSLFIAGKKNPEVFTKEEFNEIATSFYSNFYGIDIAEMGILEQID